MQKAYRKYHRYIGIISQKIYQSLYDGMKRLLAEIFPKGNPVCQRLFVPNIELWDGVLTLIEEYDMVLWQKMGKISRFCIFMKMETTVSKENGG